MNNVVRHVLILAALSACSRHDDLRAYDVKAVGRLAGNRCIVDERYVYSVGPGLDRIQRTGGGTTVLIPNLDGVENIVAIDGTVYWKDGRGIHAWSEGQVRTLDAPKAETARTLVGLTGFGERICWGVNEREDGSPMSLVMCADNGKDHGETWRTVGGFSVVDALTGTPERLFLASTASGTDCGFTDISSERDDILHDNSPPGGDRGHCAEVTAIGVRANAFPIVVRRTPTARDGRLDDGVLVVPPTASIAVVRGAPVVADGARVTKIDVRDGTQLHVGEGRAVCGDDRGLYILDGRGELLEATAR